MRPRRLTRIGVAHHLKQRRQDRFKLIDGLDVAVLVEHEEIGAAHHLAVKFSGAPHGEVSDAVRSLDGQSWHQSSPDG